MLPNLTAQHTYSELTEGRGNGKQATLPPLETYLLKSTTFLTLLMQHYHNDNSHMSLSSIQY